MKAVILAGGFGTRISEESQVRPKPMVEIGGYPILWHIMKIYSHYGVNDFVICAGYKQHMIKQYFAEYALHNSNITFDFQGRESVKVHSNFSEPWKVTVVDTGYASLTGKRIKKIQPYIGNETFMVTYGDGVSDVDIGKLLAFHRKSGAVCTLTATRPESRFGYLEMEGDMVRAFREKSAEDVGYINSGYMVMEPEVFDYIEGDVMLESGPLERLTAEGRLCAYRQDGVWQCMDTLRDKIRLEKLWDEGNPPWKVWKD